MNELDELENSATFSNEHVPMSTILIIGRQKQEYYKIVSFLYSFFFFFFFFGQGFSM